MSSTNTYTEQKYCVYITHYTGNKLPSKNNSEITPSNYIGSTSLKQINNGYKGSICSINYKSIWRSELKNNPHLFFVEIISYHDTRPEATYKELQLQRIFNVLTNPLFVNMGYAAPNGFFGMDVSGIPREDLTIRNNLNAAQGILAAQISAKNGTHHWQSEQHSVNTANRQKELAAQGKHISQIQTKEGTLYFQSEESKINTSKRTKINNKEKMSRPLYLEVKKLCEEKRYTKPRFLHMKSEEFLTALKLQLTQ